MQALASFIAHRVPRYGPDEIEARSYENLLGQRALWSGLAFLAMGRRRRAVELRLASGHDRKIELSLSLLGQDATPMDPGDARQIERLLPVEYGWARGSALFDDIAQSHESDANWRIARVVRRTEFIDLPYHSLLMAGSAPSLAPTQGVRQGPVAESRAPSAGADFHGGLLSVLTSAIGDTGGRFLPEPRTHPGELLSRRFCLPLLGAIDGMRPRSRRLFEELLEAAPVVVSFCVHPLSSGEAEAGRRVAANLKRFLAPFAAEIANSGFAEFATLRSVYDRFFLPESYLMRVSIRIAARHDEHAVSVATLVGATLGGLRAFRVHPPSRGVGLTVLRQDYLDIPRLPLGAMPDPEKCYWHDRSTASLTEAGVMFPDDESMLDFLLHLPHIYSIEEAERLMQLPIADDEGLPGFDTRLVAPFSEPSRAGAYAASTPTGELTKPPAERIRIGIAPARTAIGVAGRPPDAVDGEWHTISPTDLTKHAFVVGGTGSGKTQTTLFLLRELNRLGIDFLVIEPVKTEYYSALRPVFGDRLKRFRFEGTASGDEASDFMPFDPMRLQSGVSVARHASYLKSCFEAAFPLDPVLALMLEAGLRSYYTTVGNYGCGLKIFTRGGPQVHRVTPIRRKDRDGNDLPSGERIFPSLEGFQKFFLDYFLPEKVVKTGAGKNAAPRLAQLQEEWRQIFERRFDALSTGMIGVAARKADRNFVEDRSRYNSFDEMLDGPCIIELDGISNDEQKALMMAFILTFLFERRQAEALAALEGSSEKIGDRLRHVLVVEEAHRVLANPSRGQRGDLAGSDARGNAVSLFIDMLAEIRAFGQGLVIIEQIPTKIVPEAVKNTNLKIMLRLTSADDRDFLGEAMNFTEEQKRFVTGLRAEPGRGIDMVVFEQQLDQPKLLQLPLAALERNGSATSRPAHDQFFQTAPGEDLGQVATRE